MIIRSKEKIQNGKKVVPLWKLDTTDCVVTHFNADNMTAEEHCFSSDCVRYHLHYSAEYRPERLRKLVNSGEILNYLIDLDKAVEDALERQVNKWKANDRDYLDAVASGDIEKARGLENMLRLCAREPIFEAMVYV